MTGVRARTWSEDKVPQQAWPLVGRVDDEVLGIAVEIHNRVADPRTGQPHAPKNYPQSVAQAFAGAWAAAQEDSTAASMAVDEAYLGRARAAAKCADEALDLVAEAGTILAQAVEAPSGAQLSRRQVADEHRADSELARQREADGDYRHRQRAIRRWVILVASMGYGLVDLVLLYVPILNLRALEDRSDLIRWLIAVVLSVAQAFFLGLALREHQEAERDSTDIESADDRLRRAKFWLAVLAGTTGVLTAVRIAVLVREANFSAAGAALFGSVSGLVWGLLIVALGRLVCRGNALGDRLRTGRKIIKGTRRLEQEAIAEVTRACDAATAELDAAKAAKARGDDKRLSVARQYWEGMQLAETWLGIDPPLPRALRPVPTVEEAHQRVLEAEWALGRVRCWLGEVQQPSLERLQRETATSASAVGKSRLRPRRATGAGRHRSRADRPATFPAPVRVAMAFLDDPTSRHWGYELSRQTGVRSGVLYPMLTRMLDEGWLEDGWEDPTTIRDKRPPRRYYELTGAGRLALGVLVQQARRDARSTGLVG